MGNIIRREKIQKAKGKPNETGTKIEGLRYRSFFAVSVEGKKMKERNNSERRIVKVDGKNVNSLIKMVHDNVISQKLIFNGPFGQRRCKCIMWNKKINNFLLSKSQQFYG